MEKIRYENWKFVRMWELDEDVLSAAGVKEIKVDGDLRTVLFYY